MAKFSLPDKLNLAHLPTPIRLLEKLSLKASVNENVKIYVKRDDLTHGPAAGNKIRKLEYFFAEAIRKKTRVVVTCGGIQSNHARATAIMAKELGLECILLLKAPAVLPDCWEGNVLLDHLCGAQVRLIPQNEYENIQKVYLDVAEPYRVRDGVMPLFIPVGGSNEIGAMGYLSAYEEILSQCGKNGLPDHFDSIVVANGSGGTQGGLILGRNLHGHESKTEIFGFNVADTASKLYEDTKKVLISAIQKHHIPISFMADEIKVIDGYVGPGYAQADEPLYRMIVDIARAEGIFLDPVYTGKAMQGLLGELKKNKETAKQFGKNILFIHTGGFPSLFAHQENLSRAIQQAEKI